MQVNPTQSISEALDSDEKKRESFLDQFASIIKSNLSKNELTEDKEN
ncbi:hypothetical protein M3E13_04315 [Oceanobacillus kimchii]|nr:hypothetical protein [Oceanobacillus kimchii]MCT1577066.1 hypothetical protein [Oceanobacillus kimchii]MCT2135136.1 hypothetical protein [Oceanobacillus kimchii]